MQGAIEDTVSIDHEVQVYKTIIDTLKGNWLSFTDKEIVDVKSLSHALKGTEITTLDLSNKKIGCDGLKYLSEVLKDTQITKLGLKNNNVRDTGVKYLAESLKGTQITELDLSSNEIDCTGLKYLSRVLKDTQIVTLTLQSNNIMDEGLKYLAQFLKETKISYLDLSYNKIGCNGLESLSRVLRETQISGLFLKSNSIGNDSIRYLTEHLKDSQITTLDLSENIIKSDVAQNLIGILTDTKMEVLHLDIYGIEKYASFSYHGFRKNQILVTLYCNYIDISSDKDSAQNLNKIFRSIPFVEVTLDSFFLKVDNVKYSFEYLAEVFKDTKIKELRLSHNHFIGDGRTDLLVQVFKICQIAKLNLCSEKLRSRGAQYLASFLKEIKVLDLNLDLNYIGDKGMEYLAPALENSDIMSIQLSWNDIKVEGAKYLAKILRNSKITFIGLCNNSIGPEGARYLADGLSYSQVTGMHLYGNGIQYEGYQSLIDVVENTNISWVNLHCNNIEAVTGTLWPYSIPRSSTSIACELRCAFEELVSLNVMTNEFEFIVPSKYSIGIDQYAFLFKTLDDDPNSRVHIIKFMCGDDYLDFNIIKKIDEFIAVMPHKFKSFMDNNLPDLIKFDDDYNNYVDLVKKFEDMNMSDIVQNLLLHRVLYYVDEQQEILHPYIYKMLHKYNMLLYNEQLEPNKKEKIIAYYESHPEIDGIQDFFDLFE